MRLCIGNAMKRDQTIDDVALKIAKRHTCSVLVFSVIRNRIDKQINGRKRHINLTAIFQAVNRFATRMREKIAYYSIRFYYLMCIFEANDRTIKCGVSIEFMIWEKKRCNNTEPTRCEYKSA